jgi:hypothetical protein
MFWRWWRMEEEHRPRVWVLYGWLRGLMCVGSAFGAFTWAFWMQVLVAFFTPGLSKAQFYSLDAQGQYWAAAFYVPYAIEFMCLSVAKLLVLHRMADFAVAKGDGLSRRLAVWGRNALANALQTEIYTCNNACNPACNNVWLVILFWLEFTPEFQLTVVLISTPLALLVALWGMTDKRTLQHTRSGRGQMISMRSRSVEAAK